MEDGYLQGLISEEAFQIHNVIDSGDRPMVGVNKFLTDEAPPEVEGYEFDAKGATANWSGWPR